MLVSGNRVWARSANIAYASTMAGFNALFSNGVVEGNQVLDLLQSNTTSATSLCIGIQSSGYNGNLVLRNNYITNLRRNYAGAASTTVATIGIRSTNSTPGGVTNTVRIYNNTIVLNPSALPAVTYSSTGLLLFGGATNVFAENNLFINRFTTTGVSVALTISDGNATNAFLSSNNNVLFSGNAAGPFAAFNAVNRTTFADWKTATGNDAQSYNSDIVFSAANRAKPDSSILANWDANGTGIARPLNGTTDFAGLPRRTSVAQGTNDIGAYEFTPTVSAPDIIATGTVAANDSSVYTFNGRQVARILWPASGTLPASAPTLKYLSGVSPASVGCASQFGASTWRFDTTATNIAANVRLLFGRFETGAITDSVNRTMVAVRNRVSAGGNWSFAPLLSTLDWARGVVTRSGVANVYDLALANNQSVVITAQAVSGTSTVCANAASGGVVSLPLGQTGVSYQLLRNGVASGAPLVGTGAALNFANIRQTGTYTVVANGFTGCTVSQTGSAVITVDTVTQLAVTGAGTFCATVTGFPVGLAGSRVGTSYQLKRNGTNVGAAIAGTGNALAFGNQTVGGTFTVTGSKGSCLDTMDLAAVLTINPVPAAPAINTVSVDSLRASVVAPGYRWYRNGILLSPTTQKIRIIQNGRYAVRAVLSPCPSDTAGTVITLLAANGRLNGAAISLFPNPAQSEVTITLPSADAYTVTIISAKGQVISSQEVLGGQGKLALNNLAAGIYLVKISNAEGVLSRQLSLQR
jgi:hemin uptake protein HemP